ncbi:uncharacterized protein KQ657_003180 [Scheffersomyces spartinae]|uniref:Uncharacterized protein n=1 Tax=Scheffersomyces spartinae TaxID=45513 RepID=A0A9P8AK17_9ASCO|nr:uncharacterized protein KQ657_003180 [Scheffersomyces spartinae]KAG7195422.1 hypothetical protein KQ657_003180 [Scheffersomyces spartinae]
MLNVEELEEELASTTTEGSNDITGGQTATSAPTVDSYLQTTKEIAFVNIHSGAEAEAAPLDTTSSLGTVEQLWMSLSTLKPAYQLRYGTELLIFKSGINPVWEDPVNAKGGRWVFRFSRRGQNSSGGNNSNSRGDDNESIMRVRKRSSLIWERLVLRVLTGSIIPEGDYLEEIQELLLNDISGLVLSVRRDEDIISIWNSNLNFNKKGSTMSKDGENGTSKKLTLFQARRIICDSILRVIRECDLISQGSDCIETIDSGSNERVFGVSFEYRLHADNNTLPGVNGGDNGANGNNGTSGNGKYGGERSGRKYNNKLYHHKKEGHNNNTTNSFSQGTSTTATTTTTTTTTVSIVE